MKNLAIIRSVLALCAALGGAFACNVENTTHDTGGVGTKSDPESCPAGVSIVLSDYMATQIALSDLEGQTQSESFISSGSTETDGLAFALSGDVALPSTRPQSGNVVLLDRFGTNVITWLDPSDARVIAQLAVGTGFESNPSDYLEVSNREAFITRWGDNAQPGQQENDRGGDVLFVDLESHEISGSLELPRQYGSDAEEYPARPAGMTRIGDTVWISLSRLSSDFANMGEALLVGVSISKHEVQQVLSVHGLKD
ncbi:MAG TPA: hypothetical protein VFQ61_02940, partial [Polyangiaceae bacterium]|nr:hypothetical protein [Polyangiaceae bacterium]